MTREQLYIDGTEPPHHNPDIEAALRAWQDAKDERKSAGERVKTRHAVLISRVIEAGIERYPFTDASGRQRQIVTPAERRVRVLSVRGATKAKGRRRPMEQEDADRDVKPANKEQATPPESSDPFASARRAVNDRDREAEAALAGGDPSALAQAEHETAALEATARRAEPADATFSVGDRVTWRSQAGGNWKTKTGTVVEVVSAKRMPKKFESTSRRDHVSFVVDVDGDIYWPLVAKLKLAKGKR